jgi:hypothetical protein
MSDPTGAAAIKIKATELVDLKKVFTANTENMKPSRKRFSELKDEIIAYMEANDTTARVAHGESGEQYELKLVDGVTKPKVDAKFDKICFDEFCALHPGQGEAVKTYRKYVAEKVESLSTPVKKLSIQKPKNKGTKRKLVEVEEDPEEQEQEKASQKKAPNPNRTF